MMLVDTSGLLAALFADQRQHAAAARVVGEHARPFLMSPFVLAELDYLVMRLTDVETELALLDQVAAGAYELASFGATEVALARDVIAEYSDLGIGLTDASIVVLARNTGTTDLLTLDERHFRTLRGPQGKPFRVLPADMVR